MANSGKKSGRKDGFITAGLICLILGIVLIYFNRNNIKSGFMKPYDIYDVNADEIHKGDAVTADIDIVLDYFAEMETTHTKNGAITSRSYTYYYIIPVFDDEETYYIAIEVDSDDKSMFESIADDTWEYLYGEREYCADVPFEFTGNVQKLDDEAYDYMLEWFQDADWFETDDLDEIREYVWPLCLEKVSLPTVRTFTIVGIVLILSGILFLVLYFTVGSKKKNKDASIAETVETPVQSTASYDGNIEIGGIRYMRSDFVAVNDMIASGNIDGAVTAVRDRTGLSDEEARNVVDHWGNYYN